MRVREFGTEMILNAEAIDKCSERVTEFLTAIHTDKKEIVRIRFSVEDVLIKWQMHFGETVSIHLACYSYLGQPTIQLRLEEEPFDPLSTDGEDDFGAWSKRLLSGLQTTPMYSYSKNTNFVTFKLIRKQRSPLFWLLIALLAAAVAGAVGVLAAKDVCASIAADVLAPICNTYIGTLDFFGIPLIFLSVVLGICGVGDASSFGKIGKKMVGHFMLSLLVVTVITVFAAYPFFTFTRGAGGTNVNYNEFLNMLLGFLPTSLVKPFLDCNAMQLIIMGVVFGIAILKLDPVAKTLSVVLEDLNGILLLIAQWFTKLIPFFVFTIVVKSVWSGEIAEILVTWKSWVVTTGLQIVFLGVMAAQICLRHKVNLFVLLKKVTATFLIALGTNSCGATITEIYDCTFKMGVSPRVNGFGVPIGTSIFKPSCAIRLVVFAYLMASTYQVNVSWQWFMMVGIMAFLLSIAIPAIPGGAILLYPMLFSQLGLPAAAIPAMIAADIFFDAPCTAFCQVSAEFALVQQAGKLDLLDEQTLRSKS